MSFILSSGLESLKQAIYHYKKYNQAHTLEDLRFSLIHLDCSFELIIKEFIKNQDRILFEKDGKSLNLVNCIKSLHRAEGQIINVNYVMILHQMRNNTQHLGLNPAENHAKEVFENVLISINSFLKINFDIELSELSRLLFDRLEVKKEGFEYYLEVAESAYESGQFEIAFIAKYIALEGIVKLIIKPNRPISLTRIILDMNNEKPFLTSSQIEKFRYLTKIKNDLMHELKEIETDVLIEANDQLGELIDLTQIKLQENNEKDSNIK